MYIIFSSKYVTTCLIIYFNFVFPTLLTNNGLAGSCSLIPIYQNRQVLQAYQMTGRSIAEYERSGQMSPFNSLFDIYLLTGNGLNAQETLTDTKQEKAIMSQKKGFRNGSLFKGIICIYLKSVSGIFVFTFTSFTLKSMVCPPISVFLTNANLIPLISL